uniref:Putative Serine/threonine-protein kinase PBS1 n=1 Tax=Davidia involucrata TaxID=16924 RepID=A0A5B7BSN3_DAVIN
MGYGSLHFLCHLRSRNLKRMQQTGERKTSQEKSVLALRSQIIPSYKYGDEDKLKNGEKKGHQLQLYSFPQIVVATDNFSSSNKIGQGGFGPVFKGILPDGQHVAVKRLSRSSGQGPVEFKNEIALIAELQHMNLVKLLGYCIQGEEMMLIYEYMLNKSLDSFLFDPTKRELLDCKRQIHIVEGIAQGLLSILE